VIAINKRGKGCEILKPGLRFLECKKWNWIPNIDVSTYAYPGSTFAFIRRRKDPYMEDGISIVIQDGEKLPNGKFKISWILNHYPIGLYFHVQKVTVSKNRYAPSHLIQIIQQYNLGEILFHQLWNGVLLKDLKIFKILNSGVTSLRSSNRVISLPADATSFCQLQRKNSLLKTAGLITCWNDGTNSMGPRCHWRSNWWKNTSD